MRILIVFGTTEGHTRKLARFAGDHLRGLGHQVHVCDAAEGSVPGPAGFDAVFVAASLHIGRYQSQIVHFARAHHRALNGMASAFISVSLSAAGHDAGDWSGLRDCLARFERQTLWTPRAVHHAGGAFRFTRYDFFKRLALKFIARSRGQEADTAKDYDLTDYGALAAFVADFVSAGSPTPRSAVSAHERPPAPTRDRSAAP